MRTKTIAIGLVVVMVALAGCGGVLGGDDGDGEETLANGTVGNDTAANGTGGDAAYPPGVTESGLEDAAALANAHNESLSGEAYQLNVTQRQRIEQSGQNVTSAAERSIRVDGEGTFLVDATSARVNQTVWGNQSTAVSRIESGNDTSYQRMDPAQLRQQLSGHVLLRGYLEGGNYAVESTSDGQVTLTADEWQGSDAVPLDGENVSAYESTVVVSEDGRVQEMTVHIESSRNDASMAMDVDFALDDDGDVTVERPEWVDEA
ncbi:hypothetical protein G9464_07870 [Halostella sp. JP-L12]|uniref:hypothetical protein n=1 Tax=Halostella TaxID=1843185 RepID=UPI000EF795DE|nr:MULTISPECIES: hypothetical protein [Halostella]NHN47511.1 hypothetical protein [Halostella sp. JP-L12]